MAVTRSLGNGRGRCIICDELIKIGEPQISFYRKGDVFRPRYANMNIHSKCLEVVNQKLILDVFEEQEKL